jgi:hypothetical protein
MKGSVPDCIALPVTGFHPRDYQSQRRLDTKEHPLARYKQQEDASLANKLDSD